jgi:hypothetical protein
LAIHGLAKTGYFVHFSDSAMAVGHINGDIEIMVHTVRRGDGVLVDLSGLEIERTMQSLAIEHLLTSYRQLAAPMRMQAVA